MATELTPSPDTIAILLGAKNWPNLGISGGESFSNSFNDFKAYLRHPAGLNLPDNHFFFEFDPIKSASTISSNIVDFLKSHKAKDGTGIRNLILFLIGQGQLWNEEFYFAIPTSIQNQYPTTFLSATGLAKLFVEEARGCRHYIIIDACYAEAAANISWKAPKGVCFLCSARAAELSQSKCMSSATRIRTQFTGALLDILYGIDEPRPSAISIMKEPIRGLSFETIRNRIKKRVEDMYGENAVLPEVRSPSGPRLEGIPLLPVVYTDFLSENMADPFLPQRDEEPPKIAPQRPRRRLKVGIGLMFMGVILFIAAREWLKWGSGNAYPELESADIMQPLDNKALTIGFLPNGGAWQMVNPLKLRVRGIREFESPFDGDFEGDVIPKLHRAQINEHREQNNYKKPDVDHLVFLSPPFPPGEAPRKISLNDNINALIRVCLFDEDSNNELDRIATKTTQLGKSAAISIGENKIRGKVRLAVLVFPLQNQAYVELTKKKILDPYIRFDP